MVILDLFFISRAPRESYRQLPKPIRDPRTHQSWISDHLIWVTVVEVLADDETSRLRDFVHFEGCQHGHFRPIFHPQCLKGTLGLQNWISDHLNLNPMSVSPYQLICVNMVRARWIHVETFHRLTKLHVPTEVHVASVTCGALTCEMIQVTCHGTLIRALQPRLTCT